jgi:SAM-dependent methyltransferase
MSDSSKLETLNLKLETNNWFSSWFDSPYYHILYKERNFREAQIFMDNLTFYLNMDEGSKVLDLACGKGRHSIYLNQLGYDVLGVDLSENSIAIANKNANETLHFKVHDMRHPFEEKYDAILNMFTSFGYFENEEDNLKTLISIKESLSEYGFGVIDFMNVNNVIPNLVANEIKIVDEIEFHIKRYHSDGYIFKEIDFEANNEKFHFTEKVRAFTLQDFEKLMDEAGIFLLDTFGDYKLKKFHKLDSERLIMIFK